MSTVSPPDPPLYGHDTRVSSSHGDGLYQFLLGCKTLRETGNTEFTHTSFQRPGGAMYVPCTYIDEFFKVYRSAMKRGEDIYLTEKHRVLGPVVIDFDFRFATEPGTGTGTAEHDGALKRSYGDDTVQAFVETIAACIADIVSVPNSFNIYVLHKKSPVLGKTGVIKDGMHIIVPDIVTRPVVQFMLRDALLAHPAFKKTLASLNTTNPACEVVDRDVIEKNNWMMYGSKKPGCDPYVVTHTFAFVGDVDRLVKRVPHPFDPVKEGDNYVEMFSIRNKYEQTPTRNDMIDTVKSIQDEHDEKVKKQKTVRQYMASTFVGVVPSGHYNTSDQYESACKLVGILSESRTANYSDWIRLGWCLRNIDHRLLQQWEDISSKSSKYVPGECTKLWNTMRVGQLGVGTLHMWARQDNPDVYREMMRSDMSSLITRTISNTENDVARVVFHMYQYDYVCTSLRMKTWYEFKNHRWQRTDSGHSLRVRLSSDVFKEFHNLCGHYHNRIQTSNDDEEQQKFSGYITKLTAVARRLKCSSFKDNVLKECSELFYQKDFENRLDANPEIIGFENGVYDLNTFEFRDGRPEDYVTFSTQNDYIPLEKDSEHVQDILEFFRQVHPNENVRTYVINLLASFISGSTREERFHIWTGTGSNGKSKLVDLFEKAIGDYSCKLPVALLTNKRPASNAASSEIVQTKGKRFTCMQEPSNNERLNIGFMKELTGGDKIMARALFSEPVTFRPQFKMVLCCNDMPDVDSEDGGTWRRIRVVQFGSEFVRNPIPNTNQQPINTELSAKFVEWAPHLMAVLIDVHRRNAGKSIVEPDEVMAFTREYQKNNDHFMDFVDTRLDRTPEERRDFLLLDDLFEEFERWVRSDHIPIKVPKKKVVQSFMEKLIGKSCVVNRCIGFKGYCIRDDGGGRGVNDDDAKMTADEEGELT